MAYRLIAILGFVALALSPSFLDWEQSPEMRWQFLIYYGIAIPLVFIGLDGWVKEV